jgi:hypothetical protein
MANLTGDEREQSWREIEQALSQFEGPSGFERLAKLFSRWN